MDITKFAIIKLYLDKNQWKDITAEVKWIETIKEEGKKPYFLITYIGSGAYFEKCENIRWLKDPVEIDVETNIPSRIEKPLFNVVSALQFEDWIRFFFATGTNQSYPSNEIRWVKLSNKEKNVKNYLNYLADVTKYLEGEENNIIKDQFPDLNVPYESVLHTVIDHLNNKQFGFDRNRLIYPFAYNCAQQDAIYNALNNHISLIQGPPGTGKTQTILNIVANLLYTNKTVAIVSANNEATKNVQEKLAAANLDFLTAFIGKKENTAEFFEHDHTLPKYCKEWANEKIDRSAAEKTLSNCVLNASFALDLEIKIACLRQKINDLLREKSIFEEETKIAEKDISPKITDLVEKNFSLDKLLQLKAELELLPEDAFNHLFPRLRFYFNYRILKPNQYFADRVKMLQYLTLKQYEMQLAQLRKELNDNLYCLNYYKSEKTEEKVKELSEKLLRTHLGKRFTDDFDLTQLNYRTHFEQFLHRFPVVFSTTHSLAKTSGKHWLYDYVIIDEASEVDLASAAIAFSCAKNIVLIGDLMQLPNVIPSQKKEELLSIFTKYDLKPYQNFAKNSILSSVEEQYKNSVPNVLLNEHYRCDPEIIGFCNKRFYNDRLIIKREHEKGNGVKIVYTDPFFQRGRTNERQADIIKKELSPTLKNKDIGIIAPFKDQVELLRSKIGTGYMIDTVHKFQGREKNSIFLSTVVNKVKIDENMEEPDFMNDANLLNVAISRAKDKLILVASDELLQQKGSILCDFSRYIKYYCEDSTIEETNVYSVMDLIYQRYSPKLEEFRKKLVKVSEFQSENIIATLIEKIFCDHRYDQLGYHINEPLCSVIKTKNIQNEEDRKFVANPNTHCDFLIFYKLDKKPCLVVEVDGSHHNTSVQKARDERKDRLLGEIGIEVLRIKTTSINCRERIEEALRKSIM